MRFRHLTALVCALSLLVCLCGACGDGNAADSGHPFGFQLDEPAIGEEIAVMHTNFGDLYIRLFPEQAPKAVQNFKTLSEDGYYDGALFHRVIADFMIQSGDPTGTGSGGTSCWGTMFEDEFDASLGNLRGALSMANIGSADTNGSQFFINQRSAKALAIEEMRAYYEANRASLAYDTFEAFYASQNGLDASKLTEEILSVYEEHGGNIHLDGPLSSTGLGHTVFGQVFSGMDVVDTIAALETTETNLPMEFVCVDSIEFVTYTAQLQAAVTATTAAVSEE